MIRSKEKDAEMMFKKRRRRKGRFTDRGNMADTLAHVSMSACLTTAVIVASASETALTSPSVRLD